MNLGDVLSGLSHGNELCTSVELVTKPNLGHVLLVEHRVVILACGCGSSLCSLWLLALLGFLRLQESHLETPVQSWGLKLKPIFHLSISLVEKEGLVPWGNGWSGKLFPSTCSGQASKDVLYLTEFLCVASPKMLCCFLLDLDVSIRCYH